MKSFLRFLRLSPERSDSGKVDDLYKSEDHTLPSAKARRVRLPRGQRAREVNIRHLVEALKKHSFKPQPVRRTYIIKWKQT